MATTSNIAATRPCRRVLLAGAAALLVPRAASSQPVQARSIELAIVGRKVGGTAVIPAGRAAGVVRVTRGETIELVWTSDEPAVLHLHGYDVETRVEPGTRSSMRFHARATGRFAVETHGIGREKGRHITLVYVEVHPK
jgi:FtsP/CotA-like multicopper oxidase with cupredoxin domain